MNRSAAMIAALLAACSGPVNGPVDYASPDKQFSCRVPGDWRVLERHAGSLASFFGPPSGPKPYSAAIAVYYYLPSAYAGPREYFNKESLIAARASPLEQKEIRGRRAYVFSVEKRRSKLHSARTENVREETYLLPSQGGFYALVLLSPEDAFGRNEPAFTSLVESFQILDEK